MSPEPSWLYIALTFGLSEGLPVVVGRAGSGSLLDLGILPKTLSLKLCTRLV